MGNNNNSSGLGLGMILFLIFLILKLTNNIDWSWWWVTSPLWIPLGIGILIILIIQLSDLQMKKKFNIKKFIESVNPTESKIMDRLNESLKDRIKRQMKKVKGGDFPRWYNLLTEEEKEVYREILNELNDSFEGN